MSEQVIKLKGGAVVFVDLGKETKCRCGAYICWAKTKAGKTMPINVIPPLNKGDLVEWESHFASCPDAKEFRKPKKTFVKKNETGEWYVFGECSVCVSKDDGLWHISIAHPNRYPTYDEIKDARYEFVPGQVTMAMIFPPKKEFVNAHPNCFHLWEIK